MSNTTHLFKSFAHQSGNTSLRKRSRLVTTSVKQVDLQIDPKYIQPLTFELRQDTIYGRMDSIQADQFDKRACFTWLHCWREAGKTRARLKAVDSSYQEMINSLMDEEDWTDLRAMLTTLDRRFLSTPSSSCKLLIFRCRVIYYRHKLNRVEHHRH